MDALGQAVGVRVVVSVKSVVGDQLKDAAGPVAEEMLLKTMLHEFKVPLSPLASSVIRRFQFPFDVQPTSALFKSPSSGMKSPVNGAVPEVMLIAAPRTKQVPV